MTLVQERKLGCSTLKDPRSILAHHNCLNSPKEAKADENANCKIRGLKAKSCVSKLSHPCLPEKTQEREASGRDWPSIGCAIYADRTPQT